jgi:hypothetical protein
VPFPFTDSDQSVKRPAALLSRRDFNAEGHTVMAMITDARNPPWPLDVRIDHQSAGLKMPSVVRMKFFTLDNRLVISPPKNTPNPPPGITRSPISCLKFSQSFQSVLSFKTRQLSSRCYTRIRGTQCYR